MVSVGKKENARLIFIGTNIIYYFHVRLLVILFIDKYILALSINMINYIVLPCSAYSEDLCLFMTS